MNKVRHIPLYLMAFLLSVVTLPVFAGSVHKWVDAQGVTHYSDQLPENISNSNTIKQIDVLDSYSNSEKVDFQNDYYSVTNQWARMREERIARKQLQLEKTKQKRSAEPQVVYINQAQESRSSNVYYPAFSTFGNSRFGQRRFSGNRFTGSRFNNRFIGSRFNNFSRGSGHRLLRGNSAFGSRSGHRRGRGGSGLTLTIR